MSDANKELRAAYMSFTEKKIKYDAIASQSGLGFIPAVFEITGRMHPVILGILETVLKKAAKDKFAPFAAIWKYWISALMICMQRKLVQGIRERCFKLYGRGFDESYENRYRKIVEIGYVRHV